MNRRYEYSDDFRKGRTSEVARLARSDMMEDDITIVEIDICGIIVKRHIYITEEMLGIV